MITSVCLSVHKISTQFLNGFQRNFMTGLPTAKVWFVCVWRHCHSSVWAFWRRSLATVRLSKKNLSSWSHGKYWQLNQNNWKTEYI